MQQGVTGFSGVYPQRTEGMEKMCQILQKKSSVRIRILSLSAQEVGYGVVPVDAFDRKYREAVGRVCTKLAAYSHKVTRVVCGIGTVIKDD